MRKLLVIFVLLCLAIAEGFCVPAYPKKVKLLLADGTTIEGTLSGDEWCHWVETADGKRYQADQNGVWQSVQPRKMARKKSSAHLQVGATFPSTGKRKLLMLLLKYNGDTPTFAHSDFDNFMNQTNYKGVGSFRDYYLEQSDNKLDIETTVTEWIELPYSYYHYGSEGAPDMIIDGLRIAAQTIDLTQFDNDGDGILDGLAVIHNGEGQETSGLSTDVWSHSSTIGGISIGGVKLGRYTIEPELLDEGVQTNIGVMCHEFGHNLGAPDFYDTDYSAGGGTYFGTGQWDLMGQGIWNGDSGNRPAGINIWQRYMLGWCDMVTLTDDQHIADIPAASQSPMAFRLNTKTEGDYYILENRQPIGSFDSALPGHGLLIYHANEQLISQNIDLNTLNTTYPQAFYLVCAGANSDPNEYVSSYGITNEAYTPFPGTKHITDFNDQTLPSSRSMNGRQSYVGISNITEKNGLISFDFTNIPTPPMPVELTAEANKGIVSLSWQLEDDAATQPKQYNVYRNEEFIGSTSTCGFTDIPESEGVAIRYSVDAEYSDGNISPLVETDILVPTNRISKLTAESTESGIVIHITPQSEVTRLQSKTDYSVLDVEGMKTIEIAHRYRAEDLLIYKLGKIQKVGFVSFKNPNKVDIDACVWRADKDGQNAELVSEKNVTEFTTGDWFEATLTTPVTIMANKQYFIGLRITSKDDELNIVTDNGPQIGGLGNWAFLDGEWKEMTDIDGNFFLTASLLPYSPTVSANVTSVADVENPLADLALPIGYIVYRDGVQIGTTGNGYFLDRDGSANSTYSVTCLYRGDNESKEKYVESTTAIADIHDIQNDNTPLYDLMGRKVLHPSKGIYISGNKKIIK